MAEGRVAVVGAGLAGLSAALDLKRWGHRVTLFERSRLLGGKATSFDVDGIEVDNGQHVFLACCTEFIKFVDGLGLTFGSDADGGVGSPLYLQPRFDALVLSRGRSPARLQSANLPAPFHLLPALLRSSQLGLLGRLQVAMALLSMRKSELPGETFARWLARHHQGRLARVGFWDPFLVPAVNARMEDVSAAEAAFVIRTAFLDSSDAARFGYSRMPLGQIANLAAARLEEVRLRTPVVGLESGGTSADSVVLSLTDGRKETYDAVVVAVPPDRLKLIAGRPKDLGIFGLDQFTHAPIVDVHLWFDIPPGTVLGGRFGFAALLDSPAQWVFEKSAPAGETYLCCSMSAADRHVGSSSQELIELVQRELAAVIPALAGAKLLRAAATRDREATFIPAVGLVRPGAATTSPRVTIAGSWTDTGWPATMESAVRSGRMAAKVLHDTIAA